MDGGDVNSILQRIDSAIGRIDVALRSGAATAASQDTTRNVELLADNARLRGAVSSAIAQIDALIGAASAARGDDLPLWQSRNSAG